MKTDAGISAGRRRVPWLILLMVLCGLPAWSRSSTAQVLPAAADNSEARKYLEDSILAPTSTVLDLSSRVLTLSDGAHRVKFEVQQSNDAYYLLFLNENPNGVTDGVSNPYPVTGTGNYVIKRNLKNGSFEQIKIFLQDDPGFFIRVFPAGGSVFDPLHGADNRCFIDVYIADSRIYRSVVVPISFGQALTSSLQWLVQLTADQIDWSSLFPPEDLSAYQEVRYMVDAARKALPTLPDAEDGAMDKDGNLVFIASLKLQDDGPGFNCSGFAKWIADGLYRPATGRFLTIDELKKKHLELRGNRWSQPVENTRDPYFGLDWTRNIAVALMALDDPGRQLSPTAADVRVVPFSRYVENVGYPIADLKRVLYFLAVRDPGYFYFGSVNKEFGTAPVLRQHTHVVVLFPYFTQTGEFRVALLERNVESTLESLNRRYPDDFIHLVRARASSNYVPPVIHFAAR